MLYTALLGHPVEHSVSPVLFGALAKQIGLEYAHLKIDIAKEDDLEDCLESLTRLGFSGVNITLPYKIKIIDFCHEIDERAKAIGAVNTLVFGAGRIRGYNTDCGGASQAIRSQLKPLQLTDQAIIIGAGGAARAIAHALCHDCQELFIVNNDLKQAQRLIEHLPADKKAETKAKQLTPRRLEWLLTHCNIIINATPVGMYPNISGRIIPLEAMAKAAEQSDFEQKYFFDMIFNPYKTRFLLDAESFGAKTCSGTYMMIHQAIEAFELWTGYKLPKNLAIDNLNAKMIKALTVI